MFYDGDLQSGIALAIQQQKLVACLVRQDDNAQSQTWENEWLNESVDESEKSLGDSLAEKAVFLRLDAGTQEAGFLAAFCSLEVIPKLIIIKQGIVLEDIDSNVSAEDFKKRILSHCTPSADQSTTITSSTDTATRDVSQVVPVPQSVQNSLASQDSSAPATPLSTAQQAAGATAQPNTSTLQDVLTERNSRLDADHQRQRAVEKETDKQKKAAALERSKRMAEKQAAESSSVPAARQDYLTQQRNRQQEARAEKERILKSIEHDKLARQERERQRKAAAQGESSIAPDAAASFAPQRLDTTRATATCNLQIRLFDGSSLRSRFDSAATLSSAVRAYVDAQASSDVPYNFREMRTPLPSRTIEISEENQSLQSLGLTPSATLVLVPVKGYTDAYASSGPSGILSRGINTGYGLFSGALGLVGNAVGGVLGYRADGNREGPYMAGTGDEQEASNVEGSRMAASNSASSSMKIRTLADQRKNDDGTELYNGNHTNFQPRKKEDDDEPKL